jgi:hypothetical protein
MAEAIVSYGSNRPASTFPPLLQGKQKASPGDDLAPQAKRVCLSCFHWSIAHFSMIQRKMDPDDDYHGVPRLHPCQDDNELMRNPLFTSTFTAQDQQRPRRHGDWQLNLANMVLADSVLGPLLVPWVRYSIAFEIAPLDAALLFVGVLWCRRNNQDQEALELLLRAQIDAFKVSGLGFVPSLRLYLSRCQNQCGPELNVYDKHEHEDVASPSEDSMIIDSEHSEVMIPEFEELLLSTTEKKLSAWNTILRRFFCLDVQDTPDQDSALEETVQVLREMRLVKPKEYRSQEFLNVFKVK